MATTNETGVRRDADIAEGVELVLDGKRVFGDWYEGKGKSNDAIRREILGKLMPSVRLDGKDANFVQGVYSVAIASKEDAREVSSVEAFERFLEQHHGGLADLPTPARADAADAPDAPTDFDTAVEASRQKAADAWRKPRADRANGVAPGTVQTFSPPPDHEYHHNTAPAERLRIIEKTNAGKDDDGDDETKKAEDAMVDRDKNAWRKKKARP